MPAAPTAVPLAPVDATQPLPVVEFRLGSGRFAVAMSAVTEVGRVPDVTRVPRLPRWVVGVANWRGRILAVLDLRSLLGVDTPAVSGRSRVLVLAEDGISLGLLVDEVEGTSSLPGELAAVPGPLPGNARELLSGQVPRDDGPVAVLDVAAVLGLRDSLPRDRRAV
jgi:purine-binding chemotaxis protein CheW